MAGYSKLFSGIVTSSIWCEDDKTFKTFIAMLAMCDARGHVDGSIPGFARLVGCSIAEMEHAIERLSSPDPYSRTPDNDGRRIVAEPGGWLILNYASYREKGQAKDGSRAEYFRNYRAQHRNMLRNKSGLRDTAPASAFPGGECTQQQITLQKDWAPPVSEEAS